LLRTSSPARSAQKARVRKRLGLFAFFAKY
jgi:hypothetical protein